MKAFRYIALVVALAIPTAAIADHFTSSTSDCCAGCPDCPDCPDCPTCPHCPHGHK